MNLEVCASRFVKAALLYNELKGDHLSDKDREKIELALNEVLEVNEDEWNVLQDILNEHIAKPH